MYTLPRSDKIPESAYLKGVKDGSAPSLKHLIWALSWNDDLITKDFEGKVCKGHRTGPGIRKYYSYLDKASYLHGLEDYQDCEGSSDMSQAYYDLVGLLGEEMFYWGSNYEKHGFASCCSKGIIFYLAISPDLSIKAARVDVNECHDYGGGRTYLDATRVECDLTLQEVLLQYPSVIENLLLYTDCQLIIDAIS